MAFKFTGKVVITSKRDLDLDELEVFENWFNMFAPFVFKNLDVGGIKNVFLDFESDEFDD